MTSIAAAGRVTVFRDTVAIEPKPGAGPGMDLRGKEAGAQRPAPSAPAGPVPRPSRDSARPDPRPGRRRAGLFRLLPILALLLGALGLFSAAPAQAQTVWSATLTVHTNTGINDQFGCLRFFGNAPSCASALTP